MMDGEGVPEREDGGAPDKVLSPQVRHLVLLVFRVDIGS